VTIDQFIEVSKKGRANGDFIMHRECGTLVDLNQKTGRAVGKMKTTITQRFNWDGLEFDIDCDNRFFFFCKKNDRGEWKHAYYKVIYEKDRVVPVDGKNVPTFDEKDLNKYPYGYRHLGAAQARVGHECLTNLPTMNNEGYAKMYQAVDAWLEGSSIEEYLEIPKGAH
jgi:hypothetical protein